MIRREVWLLPQPVRTAPTEITGLLLLIWVSLGPSSVKLAPGRLDDGAYRHHVLVRDVAVGKGAIVDLQVLDQKGKVVLGIDGDAVGVQVAGQLWQGTAGPRCPGSGRP